MNRQEWRLRLAGRAGAGLLTALGSTLRYDVEGEEHLQRFRREGQPMMLAFWHRWILPLAWLHRGEGVVVLVSEHGDGEYIARIIQHLGFHTVRGSSTRGGARGLRGMIRALGDGRDVAITPDGPQGPADTFKPGGLGAAQLTGAPVIPVSVGGRGVWRLDSWDRFVVPGPFARLRVRYGPPRRIPRGAGAEELEEHARALERALGELEGAAPASLARSPAG